MKINFLTQSPHAACSQFYSNAFKNYPVNGMEFAFYDYEFKNDYDVILLMTYDAHTISRVRKASPKSKIGIIDPRGDEVLEFVKQADFLVVDSLEMIDFWAKANLPIFKFAEYPDIPIRKRKDPPTDRFIVGYHGNKVHLESSWNTAMSALSELSDRIKKPVEFKVTYSSAFTEPDRSELWYPKNCDVKYVPWNANVYHNFLSDCHVGIVPNNLPTQIMKREEGTKRWNYKDDDYTIRFKMPSNAGRGIIFGLLGIPIVTDFFPSGIELVTASAGGFAACSSAGWLTHLSDLSNDYVNDKMGKNLFDYVRQQYNFMTQINTFQYFLTAIT